MPPAPPASPRARGLRAYAGVLISTAILGYAAGVFLAQLHATAPRVAEPADPADAARLDAADAARLDAADAARLDDAGRGRAERPSGPDPARRQRLEAAADTGGQAWPARERRLARVRAGRNETPPSLAVPTRRSVQAAIDSTDPRGWLAGYGPVVETPRTPPLGVD